MLTTLPSLGFETVTPSEQEFYKALGARIAELRRDRELTQQQVADALGISQKTLAHYEVGRLRIAVSMLPDLAGVLGVSVPTVLGPLGKANTQRRI
jgi:transcriptional regulator with XRE-family HTH domain